MQLSFRQHQITGHLHNNYDGDELLLDSTLNFDLVAVFIAVDAASVIESVLIDVSAIVAAAVAAAVSVFVVTATVAVAAAAPAVAGVGVAAIVALTAAFENFVAVAAVVVSFSVGVLAIWLQKLVVAHAFVLE